MKKQKKKANKRLSSQGQIIPDGQDVSNQANLEGLGHHALVRTETLFKGPLPDPDTLERYKVIHPPIVDAIVNGFNDEKDHRMKMEKEIHQDRVKITERQQGFEILKVFSQLFATLVAIAAIVVLGLSGEDYAAATAALAIGGGGASILFMLKGMFSPKKEIDTGKD